VWALAEEENTEHICSSDDPSAKRWLFAMMKSMPRDEFAKVVVTLWAIWFARRKIIHEYEFQSPLSTHAFIQRCLQDLAVTSPHKASVSVGPKPVHR
jgi:cell division protein FtsW (lipid II flippase)